MLDPQARFEELVAKLRERDHRLTPQRIALLRLLGATAVSQRRSVAREGFVVGCLGALIGAVAGTAITALALGAAALAGWIPSLAEAIACMERNGLEVVDVENLRRHYALTLDAWAERFDRRWGEIHALDPQRFDERVRRTWRTYLWSCAELFRASRPQIGLFQVTVSKGNVGGNYPMSRAFLYDR